MASVVSSINESLRFGFEWDRDYLVSIAITLQKYITFVGSLTLHPIVFYLLLFEQRSMVPDIRIGYFFTYLALVFDEWVFCFAFRIHLLTPYAAFYCEGPLCTNGYNMYWLMILFSFSIFIVNSPFDFVLVRMHQMFVPMGSRLKLSTRVQIVMATCHSHLIVSNIIGWAVFGKECDDSEVLKNEPELRWLLDRGGRMFMFGAPGSPQYLGRELIILALTECIIAPSVVFFTGDAMRRVSMTKSALSSDSTQAMMRRMFHAFLIQLVVATINYNGILFLIFSSMVIDVSWLPGYLLAFARFAMVTLYATKCYFFGIFLVFRNIHYRRLLASNLNRIFGRNSQSGNTALKVHSVELRVVAKGS